MIHHQVTCSNRCIGQVRVSDLRESTVKLISILSCRHEKNPRHHICRWRSLRKRDIPLHFGEEGKGLISFVADRTSGLSHFALHFGRKRIPAYV
ncbi:hypothetical protein AVEN_265298-1 [Araneus ventricosus]|uniref:Uncharacterized protein n=1 Tax=Araneus ventricosus TaxID=182803 RepID=A0A4Y2EK56_ARAVE|nr:hypothetical protein AVEN_265298-1 [Araneus ventricosus]